MSFAKPHILFLLLLAAPLFGVLVFLIVRRKNLLQQFASKDLWKELAGSVDWRLHYRKAVLLCAVFVCSIFALARPQWGFELREVKQRGVDILLAIDVSRSMLTQDVSPSRLERAKLAVRDFIGRLQGDRIGLLAFAGDAFLACPLTSDYGGALMSLGILDTRSIPRGGTNMTSAVQEALKLYDEGSVNHKVFVILTDGENFEDDPLAAAAQAKEKGIRIYTIGIGTSEGDLVRVPDGKGGQEFLKDAQGNFVKSRLNEGLLQEVAVSTGGLYVRSGGAQFGLDVIYEREFSKLEKVEFESRMQRRYFERFQWPLALAVLLLIIETAWPLRKKEYQRDER